MTHNRSVQTLHRVFRDVFSNSVLLGALLVIPWHQSARAAPQAAPASLDSTLLEFSSVADLIQSARLSESSEKVHVRVKSSLASNASAFMVSDPPRLVIDLLATRRGSPQKKSLAQSKPKLFRVQKGTCCDAVRIAAHPDKVRLVLDLKEDSTIALNSQSASGELEVTLTRVPASPVEKVALISAKLQPEQSASQRAVVSVPNTVSTPQPVSRADTPDSSENASTLSSHSATGTSSKSAKTEAPRALTATTSEPVAKGQGKSPLPSTVPVLKGIEFSMSNSNADSSDPYVRLLTSHRPRYQLLKSDDRTWRLRIKNCSLAGENLNLPYFPPQDFVGLNMVRPAQDGADVVITFSLDPHARITAIPGDTEIQLRTQR